ncbi:cytochrome c [Flavobacteriaceae bacterium MAR_2010_72]|nr:cytochrome c [Flavobacteriaceae bacterium MAR_2010_72]
MFIHIIFFSKFVEISILLNMKKPLLKTCFFGVLTILCLGIFQSCTNYGSSKYIAVEGKKALPKIVDFNFHIKPILSDRCFTCHGPDENARKANLRLDIEKEAFASLESGGKAIVKGKPHKSKVMERLLTDNPELMMPPPESNLVISDYEIALIEKWIDQGAEWKTHWSFIPPLKSELPKTKNTAWAKNEIDHFILSKIEKEELATSKQTSKEKLIRRVTFDLTGLPPTLEEINNFLKDDSKNAFEKVVDRLLESERYGERLATEWLDVARYADTHGYQGDTQRRMWPWRDWVIKSFNENMPYNQFIEWQLAGDKLPNPTREQMIATGFNRNHMMNGEGGIIDEEYRVEYVADRTNTTGKAIMGMTMECARCHDHKYDPISQKEYFNFYAFYNNVDELGMAVNAAENYPYIMLTSDEEQKTLDSLNTAIDDQYKSIESYIAQLENDTSKNKKTNNTKIDLSKGLVEHITFDKISKDALQINFENKVKNRQPGYIADPTELVEGVEGKANYYDGNVSVNIGGEAGDFDVFNEFSFATWVKFPEPFKRADILHKLEFDFMGEKGYHLYINEEYLTFQMNNAWDNNFIKVTTTDEFPFAEWTHVTVTYNGTGKANGINIYFNGEKKEFKILKDNLTKTMNGWGTLMAGNSNFDGGTLDDFRAYDRTLTLPEIKTLANQKVDDTKDWFEYNVVNKDANYKTEKEKLSGLIKTRMDKIATIPEYMVMKDIQDSIRTTHILNRGAYDDPGEIVGIGTPEAILPFDENLPQDRLGLTKWLFNEKHPLTSRVMVNRLWQMVFGTGIVNTSDDFGSQGALPTHPQLLDWLAVDFRENNWDIKAIVKKMVMSATYQQSSEIKPEALEKDKYNIYLARGPRYRMSAEMIRDNALAVSDLLVEHLGGASVKPYQPKGLWAEKATLKTFFYPQDHGDSLYRRSLYTYWRRTTPPPSMITFDSPTRNFCTVKREATSTPLQALVLLNDVQFVEAARVFAERIINEGGSDIENRLKLAFRLATAREPNANEILELKKLVDESFVEFKKHPKDAKKLLTFGEYPVDNTLNTIEVAAYTMATSAILNLDETITKS